MDKTLHSTRAYVGIMGSGFEDSQFVQMDAKSARAYVMGSGLQSTKQVVKMSETERFSMEHLKELMSRREYAAVDRMMRYLVQEHAPPVEPRPPRAERPRCTAITRQGEPCKAPAVWWPGDCQPRNGKCRVHGGLSTGPKTEAGRAAIAESNRRRAEQIRAHRQSMANDDPKKPDNPMHSPCGLPA